MTPQLHSYDGSFLGLEAEEERRVALSFRTLDGGAVAVTIPAAQLLILAARIEAMRAEQPALFSARQA